MAVSIRLRRIGKNPKKNPHFRIAVYQKTINRDGRCLEELGFYSPIEGKIQMKKERYEYWLSKGAQPSETVKNIAKKGK